MNKTPIEKTDEEQLPRDDSMESCSDDVDSAGDESSLSPNESEEKITNLLNKSLQKSSSSQPGSREQMFPKPLQDVYSKMHTRNHTQFASPNVNHGTHVYLVDSQWMEQLKKVYFPSWLQPVAPPAPLPQVVATPQLDSPEMEAESSSSSLGVLTIAPLPQSANQQLLMAVKSPINRPQSQQKQKEEKVVPKLPCLSNDRIVMSMAEAQNNAGLLLCNNPENQFNHVMRDGLKIGEDFEMISKDQWRILSNCFSNGEALPCVRSFEKIQLGIRTQIEYFYQKFNLLIVSTSSDTLKFKSKKLEQDNQEGQTRKILYSVEGFKMYFSSKRTIDDLKYRVVRLISDQLGVKKFSPSRFQLWSTSFDQFDVLKDQIEQCQNEEAVFVNDQFQDLQGLEAFLVDQVFFDYKKDSLVIEIATKSQENFILQKKEVKVGDATKSDEEERQSSGLQIYAKCAYCKLPGELHFTCQCEKIFYCTKECQESDLPFHEEKCQGLQELIAGWNEFCRPRHNPSHGLTGLRNLNNSCYLSSSLQCLSHTVGLTRYFLKGNFKEELNFKNPLGTQGKLAIAYAKLIKQLWYDDKESVAPFQLKAVIAKFKKQFNNQEQQDSQELLSVLLDGIHEDLNRVQNKPLVPVIESEGNNDVEASRESWQNHLKRNQSVIVDLMHGLYKSTVKCPDCERVSVTFEPYMNISLPIPEIKLITKSVFWVPFDTSKKCVLSEFTIKSHKQIKDLMKVIAKKFNTSTRQFELALVQNDHMKRMFRKEELLQHAFNGANTDFSKCTLFAYEIDPKAFKGQHSHRRGQLQLPERAFKRTFGGEMVRASAIPAAERKEKVKLQLEEQKLQVVTHFEIVKDPQDLDKLNSRNQAIDSEALEESVFPRINYLGLDSSLIQIHLDIFDQMKPLFQKFLEARERQSGDSKDWKAFSKRKDVQVPSGLTSDKWKKLSQIEQYEMVFGSSDPSRRKLKDVPYFIRLVSKKRAKRVSQNDVSLLRTSSQMSAGCGGDWQTLNPESPPPTKIVVCCVYCNRIACKGCPLRFDDKVTLREVISRAGGKTKTGYYYSDPSRPHASKGMQDRQSKRRSTPQKSKKKSSKSSYRVSKQKSEEEKEASELTGGQEEIVEESDNFEFEISIQINDKKCWALYSTLNRYERYQTSLFSSRDSQSDEKTDSLADGVSIYDCFRQFERPEKLSQANTWYCNQCVSHKQAVKKIQVYNVPPVLIINLKRFRGSYAKQNTLVQFPLQGLDMSEFVVSGQPDPAMRPIYDLFAVSNHYGQLQAGHYTAITLNQDNWYEFNDSKVFPINQIVSPAAYILFFKRRGVDFESLDFFKIKNTLESASLNPYMTTQKEKAHMKMAGLKRSRSVDQEDEGSLLQETGGT